LIISVFLRALHLATLQGLADLIDQGKFLLTSQIGCAVHYELHGSGFVASFSAL
jgi:hypothetical protein